MSAPQGTDLYLAWGWETAENIWEGDPNHFLRAKSVTGLTAKRGYERVANMDNSGQTLKGIPTTARLTQKIEFEPDVNTISPILSHFLGKEPTISDLTGAYSWAMTPREFSESAPATWRDSIFLVGSDGDGKPVINTGTRFNEWDLKISSGKIVSNTFSALGCFDSYQSEGTADAGNTGTYAPKPILRGHRGSTQTGTLSCRVTGAAAGAYDATVKWTLAAFAGSTDIDIVFGQWYRVTLDTGVLCGVSRFESLWFCFPDDTGSVAELDEWTFTETRTLPTASYSSLDPLSAAGVEVTVGGVVKYFRDVELKVVKPLKHNDVVGSKYPIGVQKNGPWAVTLTLNRDRDDRDFLEKLISGASAAVVIYLYGNPIGATAYDEQIKINLPNMQVTDSQRDVATPNTLPEKIDLMAFRSGTTDLFDLTIWNSLSALS